MAKPRYKTLWGVTAAGSSEELYIGGYKGKDLSFESLADEGEPVLEVVVPADGKNIRLLREDEDITDQWLEHKEAELAGAVFLTYYENYGQACSLFRLTIEDLLGSTGHGKRFLARLGIRKDAGSSLPQQQTGKEVRRGSSLPAQPNMPKSTPQATSGGSSRPATEAARQQLAQPTAGLLMKKAAAASSQSAGGKRQRLQVRGACRACLAVVDRTMPSVMYHIAVFVS